MCQHFFRKKVSKFDYVCELGEKITREIPEKLFNKENSV